MKSKRAFTLVELLVVIAIIAVLIAILLPALTRARQEAQQVVCMSNMRQVGQAIVLYANENNGWLVAAQNSYLLERPTSTPVISVWCRQLRVSEFHDRDPIMSDPILICPADADHIAETNLTNYMYCRNYGFWSTTTNAWTNTGSTVYLPRKLVQFQRPATTALMIDGKPTGLTDCWYGWVDTTGITNIDPRHHGSVNILWMDAHVDSRPWSMANALTDITKLEAVGAFP